MHPTVTFPMRVAAAVLGAMRYFRFPVVSVTAYRISVGTQRHARDLVDRPPPTLMRPIFVIELGVVERGFKTTLISKQLKQVSSPSMSAVSRIAAHRVEHVGILQRQVRDTACTCPHVAFKGQLCGCGVHGIDARRWIHGRRFERAVHEESGGSAWMAAEPRHEDQG